VASSGPTTLRAHQAFHDQLYGWQNKARSPLIISTRLVEEAKEVSVAHRHKDFAEIKDEMADVASWIFALATRLEMTPFDDFVWQRFPYECDVCQKTSCECRGTI